MNPEWAGVLITVIGFVGTLFNVWITTRIKADISEMKMWCMNTFVQEKQMPTYMDAVANKIRVELSENRINH